MKVFVCRDKKGGGAAAPPYQDFVPSICRKHSADDVNHINMVGQSCRFARPNVPDPPVNRIDMNVFVCRKKESGAAAPPYQDFVPSICRRHSADDVNHIKYGRAKLPLCPAKRS